MLKRKLWSMERSSELLQGKNFVDVMYEIVPLAPGLALARKLKYNQMCKLYHCTVLICLVVLVEQTDQHKLF
jgi:hypothetical protein